MEGVQSVNISVWMRERFKRENQLTVVVAAAAAAAAFVAAALVVEFVAGH